MEEQTEKEETNNNKNNNIVEENKEEVEATFKINETYDDEKPKAIPQVRFYCFFHTHTFV